MPFEVFWLGVIWQGQVCGILNELWVSRETLLLRSLACVCGCTQI